MKSILAMAFSALLTTTAPLTAQSSDPATYTEWGAVLGLTRNIVLEIADEATDNCWTNSSAIRSNAFLKFEQNGIFVPNYDPAFIDSQTPRAQLYVLGFRTNTGRCAVSARFSVQYRSSDVLGGYEGKERFRFETVVQTFSSTGVFDSQTDANEQLAEFFDAQISEFIARGISARRSEEFQRYLEIYPPSGERPMSTEEWNQFVSEVMADIPE